MCSSTPVCNLKDLIYNMWDLACDYESKIEWNSV